MWFCCEGLGGLGAGGEGGLVWFLGVRWCLFGVGGKVYGFSGFGNGEKVWVVVVVNEVFWLSEVEVEVMLV